MMRGLHSDSSKRLTLCDVKQITDHGAEKILNSDGGVGICLISVDFHIRSQFYLQVSAKPNC